jgi:PAS domain S-box-containing protein
VVDADQTDELKFLAGGGLSGTQLRAFDWTASPLGPPAGWPQSLRTAVKLMLNTRHPLSIFWGPEAIHLFNDAAGESYGAERRAAGMARPGAISWSEIWPVIGPQFDQVMAGRGATWHENQLVPIIRDGRLEDVYWTYSYCPIDDPQAPNEVGGVLVIATETTQIVLAERRKAEEAERQRTLFEQAPGFISIMSGPEHVVEFVNREHRKLFGSNNWPGMPIRAAFPDIAGQGFLEMLDKVYATGEILKAHSAPIRYKQPGTREETTRFLDFIYAPFFDGEGRRSGVFCEGFDVTDRVEAAADLLSAEERLRLATEAADIGWWDVEAGYGRLSWPPRVKAMFGISPDVPVTMDDFYNGLHPEDRDRVAAVYEGAADPARRELYDVEYRTIGKEDGVLRWVAAKGRGVFDEAGRCKRVIGTAIDITERKLSQEEKLAREKEDAELRDQFIAVLGHDLRNPLAAVSAGTRMLLRRPERAAEISEKIERSISRMSELTANILDFARGRLGGGLVVTRDLQKPLEPVLLQVIDEHKDIHPERGIVAEIELRQPVECDRHRIGQLLSNLLGNALIYGAPNTPVEVRARVEAGQFVLSVTNAGEAIDPSALERLFQPFFRGSLRDHREGLGLGLYICNEIAKAHGGTLEVASECGKTCFTLRMPMQEQQVVADQMEAVLF